MVDEAKASSSVSFSELSHSESEDGKEVYLFDLINKNSLYEGPRPRIN